MLNDSIMNIIILIHFSKFYNNYFTDFRGREYAIGTFNYLSPIARYLIAFKNTKFINNMSIY